MTSRIQKLRREVRLRRHARARRAAVVALDAMGTDIGPEELLQGAYEALEQYPTVSVICTGPRDHLSSIVRSNGWVHPRLSIEDATEVVSMDDTPKDSLRKKHSSVAVAARLVHDDRAGAMVSAGNTGATMATAMFMWRQLPGVARPAIAAIIPHPEHPCILLDVGANVDCKPRHLFQFAVMGACYSRYVYHRRNPKIGILSIGEEESKGNELVLQTQELLRGSTLNYLGNAEGRDLLKGDFDVVVCDGFVGNVVLKFAESLAQYLMENIREELTRNIVSQLGALAMMPAFKNLKKRVDYAEYGGAPLLGLRGNCVICHGSSRAKAIRNAIRVASELVGAKVNDHIVELLQQNSPATTSVAG
jgi:phosphate acyltransferase